MKKLLVVGAASLLSYAHASVITPMEFSTQPTILTSGANISACGIRFVGAKATADDKHVDLVDGSFMFTEQFLYTVKAGHFRATLPNRKETPKNGDVSWVKIGKSQNIVPKGPLVASDSKGYKLFIADLDPGSLALEGIYSADRLWVAFRDAGGLVAVYSGKLKIDDETMSQFTDCMAGLTGRLKRELGAEEKESAKP